MSELLKVMIYRQLVSFWSTGLRNRKIIIFVVKGKWYALPQELSL